LDIEGTSGFTVYETGGRGKIAARALAGLGQGHASPVIRRIIGRIDAP
jgi:hypothetical protein